MPPFPAVLQLSSLDGSNGFQLSGEAEWDRAGETVASAGDVNGDGFGDIVIGAPWKDGNGAVYLVFGNASGFPANIDLSSLSGENGFRMEVVGELVFYSLLGISVSSAGDINGDGFSDVIVGAPGHSYYGWHYGARAAYVVFGRASGFGPSFDQSSLNGTTGFKIGSVQDFDYAGTAVAAAGDVNGDGFADVIIGAPLHSSGGLTYNGVAYVVFGKPSGFGPSFDLLSLNGGNGFEIHGARSQDRLGVVSSAGDINGDGFDDVIIGAPSADPNGSSSGISYVIFGKASGFSTTIGVSALNGINGFSISGEAAGDDSGGPVSSAGDINGDGFDDLIIGASGVDANGTNSGASYVVFGKAGGFGANLNLSALDGSNGFKIKGEHTLDASGGSVSSAGDINGDGYGDLIIGAHGADPNGAYSGASYVIFGKASGFGATLELSSLDGSNGFRIDGEAAYDHSGQVSAAGDVNGDGIDDVLIGADAADPHGPGSGAAYVVFGQVAGASLTGTVGNDSLTGTANADSIDGLAGNDTIVAGAGNDRVDGGTGADLLYGGTGNDTFYVDGQSDLVFETPGEGTDTVVASANFYLYESIEKLTLETGAGNIYGVANGLNNSVTGNAGANLLLGGGGDDMIDGGSEADTVYGENGNDVLYGGTGFYTDLVVGGDGNDVLDGSAPAADGQPRNQGDNDRLYGQLGDDTYYVDTRADLTFEFGNLSEGNDTVYADIGGDGYYLYGSTENLILLGSTPYGVGNELENMLIGSGSVNWLLGGAGNDTLNGKGGYDVLFGEGGADTFVFERGTGGDNVADFVKGADKIKLVGVGFASFAGLTAHSNLFENAGSSVIELGLGDFVVVTGVTGLTAGDFLFA